VYPIVFIEEKIIEREREKHYKKNKD